MTPATLVQPGVPIPANGSLLLDARGTRLGEVTLQDDQGKVIGGRATERVGYVVWKPERTLEVGRPHTLTIKEINGAAPANEYRIEAAEPWTPGRPAVQSTLGLKRSENHVRACCKEAPDGANSSCFDSEIVVLVNFQVVLASTARISDLTQLVFGVGVADDNGPTSVQSHYPLSHWNADSEYITWSSNRALEHYCVTLVAVEIESGTMHEYPDLDPRCVTHNVGKIESTVLQPPAEALSRATCSSPPWRHEQQWCEVNRDCASNGALDGCERYESVCGRVESGGTGGEDQAGESAAGEGSSAGRPPHKSRRSADDDSDSDESDGCSVQQTGSGTGSGAWLVAVVGAVLVRRRARRAQ